MKEYYKVNKLSASAAKVLASGLSPYAAFHKLRKPFTPTDAMKLGTIVHSIIEHGGVMTGKTLLRGRTHEKLEYYPRLSKTH